MTPRPAVLVLFALVLLAARQGAALDARAPRAEQLLPAALEVSTMPRKLTGTTFESRGVWYARITLAPKVRRAIALPTCSTEEQAEARKEMLVRIAGDLRGVAPIETIEKILRKAGEREGKALKEIKAAAAALASGRLRPKAKKPTVDATPFADVAALWTSGELARRYPDHVKARDMEHERQRLEKYVLPLVGTVPIADFDLEHAEIVMAAIPAERSPTTRRHVGQIMHRILALSVYPLKLRSSNPLPRGFLPKKGKAKMKAWLYPDEDARLLRCMAIPLCWRVFYGFLHREGPRFSEAAALDLADADIERGALKLEETKTDDPRAFALAPGDAPALGAWLHWREARGEKLGPTSPLFVDEAGERVRLDGNNARRFREHLALAGITRAELFETTATRMRIRIHDTRATFVTLALAAGKTETWVQDRTGHRSSEMINLYRRAARKAEELNLGPLLPLDEAIPELRAGPGGGAAGGGARGEGASSTASPLAKGRREASDGGRGREAAARQPEAAAPAPRCGEVPRSDTKKPARATLRDIAQGPRAILDPVGRGAEVAWPARGAQTREPYAAILAASATGFRRACMRPFVATSTK